MNTSMKEMSANKKEKVILSLIYLLFGVMFVVAGMSFYGSAYYGTSIFAELVNPASWVFGFLFGGILAVGSWFCKPAGQEMIHSSKTRRHYKAGLSHKTMK